MVEPSVTASASAVRQPPRYQLPSSIHPTSPPPGARSLGKCCSGQWLPQYSSCTWSVGGGVPANFTVTLWISRGSSQTSPVPSGSGCAKGAASNGAASTGIDPKTQQQANAKAVMQTLVCGTADFSRPGGGIASGSRRINSAVQQIEICVSTPGDFALNVRSSFILLLPDRR